jgi:hypothetical protein
MKGVNQRMNFNEKIPSSPGASASSAQAWPETFAIVVHISRSFTALFLNMEVIS